MENQVPTREHDDKPEDVSSFVRVSGFGLRHAAALDGGHSERSDVILAPIGSAGDVLPFVWLGRVLRERGHRVTLITAVVFEDVVRATGLDFVGLGSEEGFDEVLRNPDVWHGWRGPEIIFRHLGESTQLLYDAIGRTVTPGRSTLLVAPGTAFGARLAREKLGLPLISVQLQPVCYLSMYETPQLSPPLGWVSRMPRWFKRILFRLPNPMDRGAGPGVRAACAAEGIAPPRRLYSDWFHSPDGDLALFPDWFAAPQPDWPTNLFQHSFPLEDLATEQAIPPALAQFLSTGTKPILFTAGSAMRHSAEFFDAAIRACVASGRRGIFATRYPDQLPAELPPDGCSVDYAPFGRVLPHCAAIVHHGGIGTTSQALAAGVPQVVMPMAHDQPDNAARVERLGVGRTLLPPMLNAVSLASALQDLVDDPAVAHRAHELADRLRLDRGTERLLQWMTARSLMTKGAAGTAIASKHREI